MKKMKDKVYRTNPHTEDELKENIQTGILDIPQEQFLQLNSNLLPQCREGEGVQGQYFLHLCT
jgi:hypothetical protein